MTETTLYENLLDIEPPWRVRDVRLALDQGDVEVGVEFAGETLVCPACGATCPGYDRRPWVWRHAVHGAVRGNGDRLAEGSELHGGGAAVPAELELGGGDPGTGGSAGAVTAPGGRGDGHRVVETVVPTPARVRAGRQRPDDCRSRGCCTWRTAAAARPWTATATRWAERMWRRWYGWVGDSRSPRAHERRSRG